MHSGSKVAILMSGQSRTFWLMGKSIYNNVVLPNNADVFVYVEESSSINVEHEFLFREIYKDSLKGYRKINQSYIDKVMTYDAYIRTKHPLVESNPGMFRATDQYIKFEECGKMIERYEEEKGFKYDVIMRVRPDIFWTDKFIIRKDLLDKYISINYAREDWLKEYFFYGNRDLMFKLIDGLVGYIVHNNNEDYSKPPEVLFAEFINKNKIPFAPLNKLAITRITGVGMENSPYFKYSETVFERNWWHYVDHVSEEKEVNYE